MVKNHSTGFPRTELRSGLEASLTTRTVLRNEDSQPDHLEDSAAPTSFSPAQDLVGGIPLAATTVFPSLVRTDQILDDPERDLTGDRRNCEGAYLFAVTQQVRTRPPASQVARGVVALKDSSIARMAGDDQASGARAALLLLAFTLNPGFIGWRIAGKGPLKFRLPPELYLGVFPHF